METTNKNYNKTTIGYGNPDVESYNVIFDYLSSTPVNSIRTSSIPLVQYWKTYEKRIIELENLLNLELINPHINFEYATASFGEAKSSMSDIMVQTRNIRIAIEGKFTEVRYPYELIKDWRIAKDPNNRELVLDHWRRKILPYADSDLLEIETIPYQFFHRLSSACDQAPEKAILLYQIFYDESTEAHLEKFLLLLESAKAIINPKNNLKIVFQTIPCKLTESNEQLRKSDKRNTIQQCKQKSKINQSDIFMYLKDNDLYSFYEGE